MARHKFDLHMHTYYSPCSNLRPEKLLAAAVGAGLTAVAVTDHNNFFGALEALKIKREQPDRYRDLEVILGIECRTEYGEIGIVFLELEDLPILERCRAGGEGFSLKLLVRCTTELKRAGRPLLIGLNHPFASPPIKIKRLNLGTRGGLNFAALLADGLFDSREELAAFFDFTEINASNFSRRESEQARWLASNYNLPLVCNTDAHFANQVGRYYTLGYADTVRESILSGRLDRHEPDGYRMRFYAPLLKSGVLKVAHSLKESK